MSDMITLVLSVNNWCCLVIWYFNCCVSYDFLTSRPRYASYIVQLWSPITLTVNTITLMKIIVQTNNACLVYCSI